MKPRPKALPKRKPKTETDPHSYTLKGIDRPTWTRFAQRAGDDGHDIAWLFKRFIAGYADGATVRSAVLETRP